jgi:hypothetical protein
MVGAIKDTPATIDTEKVRKKVLMGRFEATLSVWQ